MTRTQAAEDFLGSERTKLSRAAALLQWSYLRVAELNLETLSDTDLAELDAFTSRFSKTFDLLSRKMLRFLYNEMMGESTFAIKDLDNFGVKIGVIADSGAFVEMRRLRNEIAHEYFTENIGGVVQEVLVATPELLEIARRAIAIEI
jgi:hypothetical protein